MDNKKTYTPEEVAIVLLKRTHELMSESKIFKAANTSHEVELGEEANNDDAEAPEYLAEADIEDDYKEDEKRRKGKKSSGSDGEAIDGEEGGEDYSEDPEHEEGMSPEAEQEHDAAENEADEQDADKIEADEEQSYPEDPEDPDEAEMEDTKDIINEAADDADIKDEKKKKKPDFGKSEILGGKLKKFMARKAMRKMEKAYIYDISSGSKIADHKEIQTKEADRQAKLREPKPKTPIMDQKAPKAPRAPKGKSRANKMVKNKAVEKILGIKGCIDND